MKHKVYMRDWYFNAGLVGFLRIITDDIEPNKLNSIAGLEVKDNYLEIDETVFDKFRIRFLKYAFQMLMNIDIYKSKYISLIKQIDNDKENKVTIKKIIAQLSSSYLRFSHDILNKDFPALTTLEELKSELHDALLQTENLNTELLFDLLIQTKEGTAYLDWFLDSWQLKGIVSTSSFDNYIQQIIKADPDKKIKNNDICLSCQTLKAENDFSNSISNIIGFNKDNSNWIWGLKSRKMKLCGLCSLIYSSALLAMVKINKYVNEDRVDCFYFLNRNTNIKNLYQATKLFQKTAVSFGTTNLTFAQLIQNAIVNILKKQSESVSDNIHFIEIIENPMLAGQSSKGYNVFNYTLTQSIAGFLKNRFLNEKAVPKGYYKIREGSYSITDELILKTVQSKLGYSDLIRYYDYYIRDNIQRKFSIYNVSHYIFEYINEITGGGMKSNKKVIDKAYGNGIELLERIKEKKRENQIDGIVYTLLNDLKIANRNGFLDKYIRLMMSNGLNARFGSSGEMVDDDKFLQFGYSFINGLLHKPKQGSDDSDKQEQKGA